MNTNMHNVHCNSQITTGIFPNHHCVLASIDFDYPENPYDDSMVNRYRDPSAGSFSYHMGRHYTVSRDMKAGDELFLDYLDCEQNATLDREWEKAVPKTAEYYEAADLVWQHYIQIKENKDNSNAYTFDYDKDSGKLVVRNNITTIDPRVMTLLPQTRTDFLTLLSRIDIQHYSRDELMMQLAKLATVEPRTPEWIRQNGQCLEHLKPGPSSLPHAGQGGIAQHRIAKGELVVPSPMLHILDKRILKIFNNQGVDSKRIQLLMNYCLGHPQSSLLLCPTTNAILINHCSTRQKNCGSGGQGPNARYEWSLGDMETNPWLKMTIDDMAKQAAHRANGLAMNVVAIRDIAPGDEVRLFRPILVIGSQCANYIIVSICVCGFANNRSFSYHSFRFSSITVLNGSRHGNVTWQIGNHPVRKIRLSRLFRQRKQMKMVNRYTNG
jgi:hypothetical protein